MRIDKRKLALLFASTTILLASMALLVRAAVGDFNVKLEPENGVYDDKVSAVIDPQASNGEAIKFNEPSENGSGQRPTRDNTGPRYALTGMTPAQFMSSKTCNRQRITGDVQFAASQTYTLTDCEITGSMSVYVRNCPALTLGEMPTINMDYVDVNGGIYFNNAAKLTMKHSYVDNLSQILADLACDGSGWGADVVAPMPFVVEDSVFYAKRAADNSGAHTEALHTGDYGDGYKFTNVAFIQQGPFNGTSTATINFAAKNAVFDGCWFLWDGGTAAYYSVYIDGPNNVVKNSWFAKGQSSFVYPSSPTMATYTNNRDVNTNALLTLP